MWFYSSRSYGFEDNIPMGKPTNSLIIAATPSSESEAPSLQVAKLGTSPPLSHNPSTHSQPHTPYTGSIANAAQQLYTTDTAGRERTAKTSRRISVALRASSVTAGALGITFFAIAVSKSGVLADDGIGEIIDSYGLWALGCTTFVASIFLLYEWISSVSPAANLIFDLLAWMALLGISILILHTPSSYDSSSCGADDRPQFDVGIGLQDAGIAVSFIALILHFVIFVRARRAVKKRREENRKTHAARIPCVDMV